MATAARKMDDEAPGPLALPEYSAVRLLRDIIHDGICFPEGSAGTIVVIHEGGVAYEVEFSIPAEEVISIRREDLQPA
jgi:hypothetical protein